MTDTAMVAVEEERVNWRSSLVFVAFVGTVWAANWALGRWGIVPIGFGLEAPAGVYFAGLAFGLRDALHELGGRAWVIAGIACGSMVAYVVESGAEIPGGLVPIAVASAVAFGFSELCDLAIYSPLRERAWTWAVVASNLVGAVVDSALFLWLAFGGLDHLAGNVIGKAYMIALALPIVAWARHRR